MKRTEQVLREAADILRKDGWSKGCVFTPSLFDALLIATRHECVRRRDLEPSLRDALFRLHIVTACSVFEYHHRHCKRAEDAIAALEIAADLAAPSPRSKK